MSKGIEYLIKLLGADKVEAGLKGVQGRMVGTGDAAKRTEKKASGLASAFGLMGTRIAALVSGAVGFQALRRGFQIINEEVEKGAALIKSYLEAMTALMSLAKDPTALQFAKGLAVEFGRPTPAVSKAYKEFLGATAVFDRGKQRSLFREVMQLQETEPDVPLSTIADLVARSSVAAPKLTARQISEMIIRAEDPGALTMGQMGQQFPRVLGLRPPGMGAPESAALFAFASTKLQPEQATTGLAQVFLKFAAPSKDLLKAFKRAGVKPGEAFMPTMRKLAAANLAPEEVKALGGEGPGVAIARAILGDVGDVQQRIDTVSAAVGGRPTAVVERLAAIRGIPGYAEERASRIAVETAEQARAQPEEQAWATAARVLEAADRKAGKHPWEIARNQWRWHKLAAVGRLMGKKPWDVLGFMYGQKVPGGQEAQVARFQRIITEPIPEAEWFEPITPGEVFKGMSDEDIKRREELLEYGAPRMRGDIMWDTPHGRRLKTTREELERRQAPQAPTTQPAATTQPAQVTYNYHYGDRYAMERDLTQLPDDAFTMGAFS